MKKLLLFMFGLLAFAGVRAQSNDPTDPSYWDEEKLAAYDAELAARYDDVIYMKSSIFPAGSGEVELPINVKCHAPFINVQFRTVMPNGAYPLDKANELGEMKVIIVPTDRISADALDGKNFTDEGYTQYVSSKQGFCSGDDGVFCSVKLNITGWEAGVYDLVVNSGAILSGFAPDDANGRRQVNAEIKTKLVITDGIVLDEMATTFPLDFNKSYENKKVKVKRTLTAGHYSTICLPFDMSAKDCEAVFGSYDLADFSGYQTTMEGNDVVDIDVQFEEVADKIIKANHPYIIKTSKDVTEFTLENVTINASENIKKTVSTSYTIPGVGTFPVELGSLIGTYVNNTILDNENYLFLSGNNFYYSNGSTKMKGYRAYFNLTQVLADKSVSGVKINFNVNDTPTSIDGISTIEKVATGVYNVSGQKVSESSLEGLPKGIYIVNGKKVFKK